MAASGRTRGARPSRPPTNDNAEHGGQAVSFLQEKLTDKSPAELTLKSRALQDAIYNHRTSAPLVF